MTRTVVRKFSLTGWEGVMSPAPNSRGLRIERGLVARAVSPPEQVAEVKAIACELPATHSLPLGRLRAVDCTDSSWSAA